MTPNDGTGSAPIMRMTGISKRYGGVVALDGVDFTCKRNSIHAVLGENGAGKSTLIKIIAGAVRPDTGKMELDGAPVTFDGPLDAVRHGIVCVFQELSMVSDLSIADNICITSPPRFAGFINQRAQRREAEALLQRVGCGDVDPSMPVRDLPLSRRQLVELAKALRRRPRLLVMDEATSALTAADVESVYRILRGLRDEGLAILYISHRMHEIEALADTCSVFRSGRHIETFKRGTRDPDAIVRLMIGREITQVYPPKPASVGGEVALEAQELSWTERLDGISLSIRKGEIVGLGGLDGQGQRELLLALFGVLKDVRGGVRIDGRVAVIRGPVEAKSAAFGLAMVPEDRKTEGLLLPMSLRHNIVLPSLDRLTSGLLLSASAEEALVKDGVQRMQIKTASADLPVGRLSGGNQQKVVLAKWLATAPRILLLMDPTRGIDVGTKQELYLLMRKLAESGTAILFYSTDYDELIGLCDRVLIMYRGRIVKELTDSAINEENIVSAALNIPLDAGTEQRA